ncbi:MAG: helix-turn-helix transcriptional regulator [Clostridia bacterium]|nr:helix-turn-helix transcriptional regulator [Clostridia bacterium]
MSLGENIYALRTSKNLSQGELSDMLDVSRQSVSKWETDAAIPDLDKLMKMCDVFGVTLDELTGRSQTETRREYRIEAPASPPAFPTVKIVGCILLASTLLASIILFILTNDIEDYYIPLPFLLSALACSLICLFVKRNIGYWCAWAILAPFPVLSCHIAATPIFPTIYITLITVCIAMGIAANKAFKGLAVQTSITKTVLLAVGDILAITAYICAPVFLFPYDWISMCIIEYITYSILALLFSYSVCYIRSLKTN